MKPKIPAVPLPVWKELYIAAQQFYSLKPWELLDDLDLVCVHDPVSDTTGFGVVMGSGGTMFGFSLYRGIEGLEIYRRLINPDAKDDFLDIFHIQNCLKVEFCSKAELEPEDHRIIKQLDIAFKGNNTWPQFRSHLPKYAPWFLTENEARLLILGLRAACHHYEQVDKGIIDESMQNNKCLMHIPSNDSCSAFHTEWKPLPVIQNAANLSVLNLAEINSIKGKPLNQDKAWEADIVCIPSVINEGDRPYFLRIPALCDADSGFAFQTNPALPEISNHQLLSDSICSVINKLGYRPKTIFFKNTADIKALSSLGKTLEISIRKKKILRTILDFRENMMSYFTKGKFN